MEKFTKTILASVAFATACFTSHAAINTIGGAFYNPANGHSYYLVSAGTWNDAEAFAQTLGGHLATINDAAENEWVFSTVIATDPSRNPWIGLYAANWTGPWSWSSGEAVTYMNFSFIEPNGIGGAPWGANVYPVTASWQGPGTWNDAPMADLNQGVVEVVPEPTTISLVLLTGIGLAFARSRKR